MVYKSLKSLLTSIPFGESFFLISWYANFHIFRDIIYYESIKISIDREYDIDTVDNNLQKILEWNIENKQNYKYWYEYNPFLYCSIGGNDKYKSLKKMIMILNTFI